MKKQLLTKKEVSESLSVSVEVVKDLVKENKLEEVEVRPGITRIRRSSVFKYLNQNKKGFSLSRIFTFLWLTAIAAFGIQLYIFATFFNEKVTVPSWLLVLMFINISLGVLFFLGIVISGNRKTNWFPKKSVWSVYLFYLLLAVTPVLAGANISPNKTSVPTVIPTPTISTTPTPTQKVQVKQNTQPNTNTNTGTQIDCVGPDGKTFKSTKKECDSFNTAWGKAPTPDPNEIIKCTIHPNCGGGYREMTRASCSQMVCCTVDLNNTTKFTSKEQCSREQNQSLSKSHTDFCNTMCAAYDSNTCANYYEVGTVGRSNCIVEMTSEKTECLLSCYDNK